MESSLFLITKRGSRRGRLLSSKSVFIAADRGCLGSRMNSAAAGISLLVLLALSGTEGQNGWAVSYPRTQVCASEGSTVEISSSYTNPEEEHGRALSVVEELWFISLEDQQPLDLRTLPQFAGRVESSCQWRTCSLTIRELRRNDSAVYRFRFITNTERGRFTGEPGVNLTVTGLQVKEGRYRFSCESQCSLTSPLSYVWYQNQEAVWGQTSKTFSTYRSSASDSVSCAVKGLEAFPSPTKCVSADSSCKKVTYPERNICAFKGSSVKFSCVYESWTTTPYWTRSEYGHFQEVYSWQNRVQINTDGKESTLKITDLRESDSAKYLCQQSSRYPTWTGRFPGTTLTVRDPDLQVQVLVSPTGPKLVCHSRCLQDRFPFVWYENNQPVPGETSASYSRSVGPETSYSCGYLQHRSAAVYAPTNASVTMSPPGGAVQNGAVTLTCQSDASPAAKYAWFRGNQGEPVREGGRLFFRSLQASDCGEYFCTAQNQLGTKTSKRVSVELQYGPKSCSVSASPSAEVEEGSPVTLSCSSDANPAATYSWFKESRSLDQEQEGVYRLSSIWSEDRGMYRCRAENPFGESSCSVLLDVQYGPKTCSVSASPSAEVEEGSSVTLSCSSDANPAANYSWFKDNQSLRGGQHLQIIVQPEDRGFYSCNAANEFGSVNSPARFLDVQAGPSSAALVTNLIRSSVVLVTSLLLLLVGLWMRRKKREISRTEAEEEVETVGMRNISAPVSPRRLLIGS